MKNERKDERASTLMESAERVSCYKSYRTYAININIIIIIIHKPHINHV